MNRRFVISAASLALSLVWPASATEGPNVHALTGARIVVAPGREIASGTVVLRDGVIEAVGAALEVPPDARVWDYEGLSLYPGFIEPYSTQGWPEADEDQKPDAGHPNDLIVPQREMFQFAHDPSRASRLRQAGFTTAVVAPEPGLLRGHSVLINLGDGPVGANLLRQRVAQNVTLRTADEGYPNSLMGATALFRQAILDARWYAQAHQSYRQHPGQERPRFDSALEDLAPVLHREEPVVFETRGIHDTLRVAALVEELGLDALVIGNGEEYRHLRASAATELVHVLPLDFPKAPVVGSQDDLTVDLADLRHWHQAPENPALLIGAGVEVAFTTHGLSDPKKLHANLAQAIERGLDPADALAALTTAPARILGIEDLAGSIEVGKMANLVVVEGDLFVEETKIRDVWIDGRHYEVKDVKPPTIDPAGTWQMEISAGPTGQIQAVIELKGEAGSLTGTMQIMGNTLELSSAEVSGNTIEISVDSSPIGLPGMVTMGLEVEGDSATGSGSSPMGPFTLDATRTAKPTPEELP